MTLREALRIVIEEEYLEDWIYDVRARACSSRDGFTGDSWDHPRVVRFSEAVSVLKKEFAQMAAGPEK